MLLAADGSATEIGDGRALEVDRVLVEEEVPARSPSIEQPAAKAEEPGHTGVGVKARSFEVSAGREVTELSPEDAELLLGAGVAPDRDVIGGQEHLSGSAVARADQQAHRARLSLDRTLVTREGWPLAIVAQRCGIAGRELRADR
jgi:hypothetical protein